jgi:hypothetical protein
MYNKYITVNPNPRNQWRGIGHQFVCFIVSYILSKKYNLKFVYQPFSGENDGTFAPKKSNAFQVDQPVKLWNRFLNFDKGELTLDDVKNVRRIEVLYIGPEACFSLHPKFEKLFNKEYDEDVLFVIPDDKDGMFIHIDWEVFNDDNINCLRNKYHLAKSKTPQVCSTLNPNYINIALHRRAGDVSEHTPFNRWMPLDYYLNIINNINELDFINKHLIHIFSYDMDEKEIEVLNKKESIKLHINENTFQTFHDMVNCDILINGQSSFSIMCAYLSYGIKLCTPWHMHWNNFPKNIYDIIEVKQDSSFDVNKVLKALEIKDERRSYYQDNRFIV